MARRTVLVGGGVGFGLAVGWLGWPRADVAGLAAVAGTSVLGAFVRVAADGRVFVVVPQAEMGQGVWTALAGLVADEMGADWRTVAVEPAPLGAVYANRALLADGFAGLSGPVGAVARWSAARLSERLDVQMTGGSTSVRAFEGPMRRAGGAARVLLCRAAARRWEADWRDCRAADGFVTLGARRARFGELAEAAALERVRGGDIVLRPVARMGAARARLDVPAKVDGSARFGADVRLPGMAFAAIRHAPMGVVARAEVDGGLPPETVLGPGWVAATGETWWAAERAVGALRLRWPAGAADSAAYAARLRAALDGMAPPPGAGTLVDARYSVPFVAHAAMETMTATCRIGDGGVEVWAPTQSTRLTTLCVARALGVGEGAVTVYPTLVGGGFGRKIESDAAVEAALIARALGRPVQLVWSRAEDFGHGFARNAAAGRLMARLGPGGAIAAMRVRVAAPTTGDAFARRNLGFGMGGGPDPGMIDGAAVLPYAVADFAAEHVPVPSEVPTGWWRSVAHSYTAFFVESFIDECARAARADPLDYRLGLLKPRPREAEVLRAAAEEAGYAPGMGVALHPCFGSIVAAVVELADGGARVARITQAVQLGHAVHPDGVRQQIEGGTIWGLSAALSGRMTVAGGVVGERGFDGQPLIGLADTPEIGVVILADGAAAGGVGEAGVPCVAPALANALAARGPRLRDLPLRLS